MTDTRNPFISMVGQGRIELPTLGFSVITERVDFCLPSLLLPVIIRHLENKATVSFCDIVASFVLVTIQ